jgi:hypothetical protein
VLIHSRWIAILTWFWKVLVKWWMWSAVMEEESYLLNALTFLLVGPYSLLLAYWSVGRFVLVLSPILCRALEFSLMRADFFFLAMNPLSFAPKKKEKKKKVMWSVKFLLPFTKKSIGRLQSWTLPTCYKSSLGDKRKNTASD